MTHIHHLINLINKINFNKYINSDMDQKFEYIRRIVKDNFGVDDMYRN